MAGVDDTDVREPLVEGVDAVLGVGFEFEVSIALAAVAMLGSPASPLCGWDSCGCTTGLLIGYDARTDAAGFGVISVTESFVLFFPSSVTIRGGCGGC